MNGHFFVLIKTQTMKKLIVFLSLFITSIATFAQIDADIDYMEVRLIGGSWQFRTAPNTFFQPMGYFGRHIKPYLQQDPLAYNFFKKYKRNAYATIGSHIVLSTSLTLTMFGLAEGNNQLATIGVGGILISGGLVYFTNNMSLKYLQTSVDMYNRSKNPTLTQFRPLIPSVGLSRHSLGLGLKWNVY